MTGADTLQQFVSGATAEITLQPGVTAVGKYNADGTAEIEAWNETFRRTWFVKGDDQVCYSDVETNCFSFEENLDDLTGYRARNLQTGSNPLTTSDPISSFVSAFHLWSSCPGESGADTTARAEGYKGENAVTPLSGC